MSDRFFLSLYLPLRDVGIYLIGTSIAAVIKFFPAAFGTAWMPFAFDSMRRADAPRLYARLATYAFGVLVVCGLVVAGLADDVVDLMVPPEFQAAATVVPLLTLGMAIQALMGFLATSLNIAKRTRPYPLIAAVGAAASVIGSVLLIPRLGMLGAALATVAGQTVATATMVYFAQRAYRIPYETGRLAKLTAAAVAAYFTMTLVGGPPGWPSLLARVGVIALVPIALVALRFFERHELAEMRQAVAAVAALRRREVTH
jgi:O-antigen/teichoic acid export membrane protein